MQGAQVWGPARSHSWLASGQMFSHRNNIRYRFSATPALLPSPIFPSSSAAAALRGPDLSWVREWQEGGRRPTAEL